VVVVGGGGGGYGDVESVNSILLSQRSKRSFCPNKEEDTWRYFFFFRAEFLLIQ